MENAMLAARGYKTKKALKEAKGTQFTYTETSVFGEEHKDDGTVTVVGPSPTERKWYATVTCQAGIITKVT